METITMIRVFAGVLLMLVLGVLVYRRKKLA
jgi:LPXTG-motif cell wall-anchored protein